MTYEEANRLAKTHLCSCGNTLTVQLSGVYDENREQVCSVICPGNPSHTEFIKQKGFYQLYREGLVDGHIAHNIARKERQKMVADLECAERIKRKEKRR